MSTASRVTFFAPANVDSAGNVQFAKHGHHGFGGVMAFLGSNTGVFRNKTDICNPAAFSCYYVATFDFIVARPNPLHGGLPGHGQWIDLFNRYFVNKFPAAPPTTVQITSGRTAISTFGVSTGRVRMSQTQGSFPTIHTVTGKDDRTHLGLGNITLVTGWLGHTFSPGFPPSQWGGTTTYKFVFGAGHATPSLATPALGALGGLMGIAAVYVIRKRSTRK